MTERQDPFEPRPETPETFVIRTPLTEAQETALVDWVVRVGRGDSVSFTDLLQAVGVRVESSAPVVAYIPDDVLEDFSSEEPMDGIEDVILRDPCTGYTPIIRQSDHLAALAEKEAEVERLREALNSIAEFDTSEGVSVRRYR